MTTATYAPTPVTTAAPQYQAHGIMSPVVALAAQPVLPPHLVQQPVFQPYGVTADITRALSPYIGQGISALTGSPQAASAATTVANALASLIPFGVQPIMPQQVVRQPQLQPYGIGGDLLGALGGAAANAFGVPQLAPIASTLSSLVPFGAQPSIPPQVIQHQPQLQPQLQPYGVVGGYLGNTLGGLGGGAIGNLLGNSSLGSQIGSTLGTALGGILSPFAATPWTGTPVVVGPRYGVN